MRHIHLTLDKREILQRLLEQGHSIRSCASIFGYSSSTIKKEIRKGTRDLDGRVKYDCQRSHR